MSSPRRGWGRIRLGAALVVLAVFGVVSLRAALLAGPAFNSDLRAEGPTGDWRIADTIALYYEPTYLRKQAANWIENAASTGDVASAAEARTLLRRSLADAPANIYSWAELAWAEVALSDADAARAALDESWRLGPYSADLSLNRLLLASTLGLEDDPAARDAILRDLAVARRNDARAFAAVMEIRPRLKALAETLPPDGPPQDGTAG